MALLSATQASKAVGKSVPTITRAIKSGKLSAERREGGGYDIEPSELLRVWPAISNGSYATPVMSRNETQNETSALQREVNLLREMLDETKADRDEWKEQAKRVTLLVEDHNAKPKGFWARLRG
jgi:hypothetical protein